MAQEIQTFTTDSVDATNTLSIAEPWYKQELGSVQDLKSVMNDAI